MKIDKSYGMPSRPSIYMIIDSPSRFYGIKIEAGIYVYETYGAGWENRQYLWEYIKK